MKDRLEDIAAGTRAQAQTFLDEFHPPIELKVARCRDYSALLRGEHEPPSTLDLLIEWAVERGRVIVCGRGASGKSVLLNRVAICAAERGLAPFLVRLSRWDQSASESWKAARESTR